MYVCEHASETVTGAPIPTVSYKCFTLSSSLVLGLQGVRRPPVSRICHQEPATAGIVTVLIPTRRPTNLAGISKARKNRAKPSKKQPLSDARLSAPGSGPLRRTPASREDGLFSSASALAPGLVEQHQFFAALAFSPRNFLWAPMLTVAYNGITMGL